MKRREFLRFGIAAVRPQIPGSQFLSDFGNSGGVIVELQRNEGLMRSIFGLDRVTSWDTFSRNHMNASLLPLLPKIVGNISTILHRSSPKDLYESIFQTDPDTATQTFCHIFGEISPEQRKKAIFHLFPQHNSELSDLTLSRVFDEYSSIVGKYLPHSLSHSSTFGHWLGRTNEANFHHFLDFAKNLGSIERDSSFGVMIDWFVGTCKYPQLQQDNELHTLRIAKLFTVLPLQSKTKLVSILCQDSDIWHDFISCMEEYPQLSTISEVTRLRAIGDQFMNMLEPLEEELCREIITEEEYASIHQKLMRSITSVISQIFPEKESPDKSVIDADSNISLVLPEFVKEVPSIPPMSLSPLPEEI